MGGRDGRHGDRDYNGGIKSPNRQHGGLNPQRQRGFVPTRRIETPTLNDMRARQGAVVGKFMNFMHRKNTLVIELYERAFYTRKPNWDQLAGFVYSDLCPSAELRGGVVDVQLHPVKMMVFIKFKTEQVRDEVVTRLQGMNGVMWTEYGVPVRGYSLDATVKVITVMGASPETTEEDIKVAFVEAAIGEVVELTRGLLDPRRLPGVTNGKWKVRVKIENPDKEIPSYIIRKEEGELWSLQFEGRRFVCWKCGSPEHIGDKCREQERTFEEVFGGDDEPAPVSWAAIVKGNTGTGPDLTVKRDAIAKQIKENNERKEREKREAGERRQAEAAEQEKVRAESEAERQRVIATAQEQGQGVFDNGTEGVRAEDIGEQDFLDDQKDDQLLAGVVENPMVEEITLPELLPRGDAEVQGVDGVGGQGGGGLEGGGEQGTLQLDWVDKSLQQPAFSLLGDNGLGGRGFTLDTSLERVFGTGATLLAIEFEGGSEARVESEESSSDSSSESEECMSVSTPSRDEVGKKRSRGRAKFGNISGISGLEGNHELSSSEGDISEDVDKEIKKPRLATECEQVGSVTIADPVGTVAVEENGEPGESLVEQHDVVLLEDPGPLDGDGKFSSGGTQ